MSLRERTRDRIDWDFVRSWKCGVLVTLLVTVLVLFGVFHFVLPSLQPTATETSTPSFLQSRGVNWHVFVEEPITLSEVQPLMVVFTDQVNVLFKIRTYALVYEYVENDGIENYSSGYSGRVYASFQAPARGPVEIPIYFLTGYGYSWDPPQKIPAWAYPTPKYFEEVNDLFFRIVMTEDTEDPDTVRLTANRMDNLVVLLHEFGHNIGLKDLYIGGDIPGCSDLPVIMGSVLSLDAEYESYDSPPRYNRLIMNRTWHIHPALDVDEPITLMSIEEAYLENNTLFFVSYNIVLRGGGLTNISNANVVVYDLDQFRSMWTIEQAAFIGMDGRFSFSCPQEFR